MRKRRLFIAFLAVLIGGVVAVATLMLSASAGFKPAAICPGASAYVYEVPGSPGQTPPAPAWPPGGNGYWGWMPRWTPLKVGNWLSVNGTPWRITAIAALPGDCRFFGTDGLVRPGHPAGGTLSGRLVLEPVK